MIVDLLSNARSYHALSPRFAAAFEYLAGTDFSNVPHGRVDVKGDDVYAMVQGYDTRVVNAQTKWESHRTYADIQFIVKGDERMGYAFRESLKVTLPYEAARDVELYEAVDGTHYDFVRMTTGMFTIFLPQDAHLPGAAIDQPLPVSKVVMKVRV